MSYTDDLEQDIADIKKAIDRAEKERSRMVLLAACLGTGAFVISGIDIALAMVFIVSAVAMSVSYSNKVLLLKAELREYLRMRR